MRRITLWASTALTLQACSPEGASADASRVGPGLASPAASLAPLSAEINPRLLRRFQPIHAAPHPGNDPAFSAQIDLGRRLFYDARLSKAGDLSCNSCHDLHRYGADDSGPTSAGASGQRGARNAPTVYHAAGSFAQLWDGRAADVERQAAEPILNPAEMAMSGPEEVIAALRRAPGYASAFHTAFPGEASPLVFDNVGRAIGAFERGLVTPGRWDRFLEGDRGALSAAEKEGLKTFLNVGCMVCHTGPYLGGSMFERAGVVEPWPNQADTGRMMVTHDAADRMMFKVPTLRNVAQTGPYFHDGSARTLETAVRMMGEHQLGLDLSAGEVDSIVTWLKALTGDLPEAYIARPVAYSETAARRANR